MHSALFSCSKETNSKVDSEWGVAGDRDWKAGCGEGLQTTLTGLLLNIYFSGNPSQDYFNKCKSEDTEKGYEYTQEKKDTSLVPHSEKARTEERSVQKEDQCLMHKSEVSKHS